ncbi:MAG: hypothetical protein HOQ34_07825 [Gemmatimonadaceae bacterium]|nr:hypothetical protein [Gemmatimonadaceae bacterium]
MSEATLRVTLRYGVQGPSLEHLEPGQTYPLPDRFARELVASGRAVFAADQPEPAIVPLTVSGNITDGDPLVSHRDPVSPRRGRK